MSSEGQSPGDFVPMRIFVLYRGSRVTVDVSPTDRVSDVKSVVREAFSLGPDQSPSGLEGSEKKILSLMHSGSDLADHWVMLDVGITSGSTVKAILKDQVKPCLYIYAVYNQETYPILEKIQIQVMKVSDLRAIVTRKSGIPVGVFRLVNSEGVEMYDCHVLDDYDVNVGDTVQMETWDGWNEFLNLCTRGATGQVFNLFSTSDDVMARYQMKVALYMSAHFGHVDLAVSLIRQGVRADEPIGDHPSRLWCRTENEAHIDSLKAPVHEASEMGQLGVLRAFVHNNVCNVLAKDGNGLTPLNIALRKKQKPCASFLLTKQWSKINYTTKTAIPLNIYVKMRRWGDRAKDKVLIIYGQWKSSVKNAKRHVPNGALVGHGVLLDGFSQSKMTSKPLGIVKISEQEEMRKKKRLEIYHQAWKERVALDPETYFKGLNSMSQFKLPRLNKWGKMLNNAAKDEYEKRMVDDTKSETKSSDSADKDSTMSTPEPLRKYRVRTPTQNVTSPVKLPPIQEKQKGLNRNLSSQNVSGDLDVGTRNAGQGGNRSAYIQTGYKSNNARQKGSTSVEGSDEEEQPPHAMAKRTVPILKAGGAGPNMAMVSYNSTPRSSGMYGPSKNEIISRVTLQQYEKYRGIPSRDYAVKCLSVANSFTDKPWLHRVRQAMAIATQGVRKTVARKPHLFVDEHRLQTAEMDSGHPLQEGRAIATA